MSAPYGADRVPVPLQSVQATSCVPAPVSPTSDTLLWTASRTDELGSRGTPDAKRAWGQLESRKTSRAGSQRRRNRPEAFARGNRRHRAHVSRARPAKTPASAPTVRTAGDEPNLPDVRCGAESGLGSNEAGLGRAAEGAGEGQVRTQSVRFRGSATIKL